MSTRHENLQRWRRIAAGELEDAGADTEALLAWVRERAARIVAADASDAGKRPGALVSAVGLSSKAAALEPLREQLEVVDEFPFRDEEGNERPPKRGERMDGYMKVARASGLVDDDPTDEQLRHRIKRLLGRDL